MAAGETTYADGRGALTNLLQAGTSLTPTSLELLSLQEALEIDHFVGLHAHAPLVFEADVTCMDLLRRIAPQDGQVGRGLSAIFVKSCVKDQQNSCDVLAAHHHHTDAASVHQL